MSTSNANTHFNDWRSHLCSFDLRSDSKECRAHIERGRIQDVIIEIIRSKITTFFSHVCSVSFDMNVIRHRRGESLAHGQIYVRYKGRHLVRFWTTDRQSTLEPRVKFSGLTESSTEILPSRFLTRNGVERGDMIS